MENQGSTVQTPTIISMWLETEANDTEMWQNLAFLVHRNNMKTLQQASLWNIYKERNFTINFVGIG